MKTLNSKYVILVTIGVYILSTTGVHAQPGNMFVRYINHGEQNNVEINDIYETGNNYILAGGVQFAGEERIKGFWLVGTSLDGEVIWEETYVPEGEPPRLCNAFTVIQTDDGGYVMGGERGNSNPFSILKLDADREIEWWNNYGNDNNVAPCYTVIELKSDDLLAASGYVEDEVWFGYVIKLDLEGNVIWEQSYQGASRLRSIRETEGGYVIGGGRHLIKIDEDGELIWNREHDIHGRQLISCRDGGFAMSGERLPLNWDVDPSLFRLLRVDDEGRQIWLEEYDSRNGGDPHEGFASLVQMADDGFMLVGGGDNRDQVCTILRTNSAGEEQWRRYDSWGERGYNYYSSVVLDDDGFAIAAGGCQRERSRKEGVIVKLIPMISAPIIQSYQPQLSEFSVLLGDSVMFAVEAIDLQEDSLRYVWTVDEDTVATDTSAVVQFEELGDIVVKCLVSDGELADSVQWRVHVSEFFIRDFEPNIREMIVRRDSTVHFAMEAVSIDEDPISYFYTLDDSLVAEEASVDITFSTLRELPFEVLGVAFQGEKTDEIIWLVHVRSVVWAWWPPEDSLRVPLDDIVEFGVEPFNTESDSLSCLWTVDGDSVSGELEVDVAFPDEGISEVVAYVNDGCEADTLHWTVDVYDPESVERQAGMPVLPGEVTLYPPSPNPFNSSAAITYHLPTQENVRLSIVDLRGRMVTTLVDAVKAAGDYKLTWQAVNVPNGIYLCRLEAGSQIRITKMVLVR